MCSRNARCIATSYSKFIIESSSGGLTWTTTSLNMTPRGVYCDIEDFCVLVGNNGAIMASDVIQSWWSVGAVHLGGCVGLDAYNPDIKTTTLSGPWKSITDSNGIVVSTNGTFWNTYSSGSVQDIDFLVANWNNYHWISVDRTGNFMRSVDPEPSCNWEIELSSPSSTVMLYVIAVFDDFVGTGYVVDK